MCSHLEDQPLCLMLSGLMIFLRESIYETQRGQYYMNDKPTTTIHDWYIAWTTLTNTKYLGRFNYTWFQFQTDIYGAFRHRVFVNVVHALFNNRADAISRLTVEANT